MICVLDIETTGLDPKTDAIVEIACVYISTAGVIGEPRVSLVYPMRQIPPEASAVHHIIDTDVVDAPLLYEAINLVHRHIHKIQGPPSLGQADHRNRRGFIVGLTNGSEPPLYLLSESVH
jgi:hypothetical protein